MSQDLSELIKKRKEDYNHHLVNKLNDAQLSQKSFWKIIKPFYNGNKIPINTSNYNKESINQTNIFHYKNLQDYLGNKVVFVQVER